MPRKQDREYKDLDEDLSTVLTTAAKDIGLNLSSLASSKAMGKRDRHDLAKSLYSDYKYAQGKGNWNQSLESFKKWLKLNFRDLNIQDNDIENIIKKAGIKTDDVSVKQRTKQLDSAQTNESFSFLKYLMEETSLDDKEVHQLMQSLATWMDEKEWQLPKSVKTDNKQPTKQGSEEKQKDTQEKQKDTEEKQKDTKEKDTSLIGRYQLKEIKENYDDVDMVLLVVYITAMVLDVFPILEEPTQENKEKLSRLIMNNGTFKPSSIHALDVPVFEVFFKNYSASFDNKDIESILRVLKPMDLTGKIKQDQKRPLEFIKSVMNINVKQLGS